MGGNKEVLRGKMEDEITLKEWEWERLEEVRRERHIVRWRRMNEGNGAEEQNTARQREEETNRKTAGEKMWEGKNGK